MIHAGEDYKSIPKEALLMRWINFHLESTPLANVKNFGSDLKNGEVYLYLLNKLYKQEFDEMKRDEILSMPVSQRVEHVVHVAGDLCNETRGVIVAADILESREKVNTFCQSLCFNS